MTSRSAGKRSISTKKRRERKKQLQHDIAKKTMESKKAHIKNLSDYDLTREEINLLSRGLNYIPTPVTNDSHIRKTLLKDFAALKGECAYSLSSTAEIKSRILST